jgi:hypothetical protein
MRLSHSLDSQLSLQTIMAVQKQGFSTGLLAAMFLPQPSEAQPCQPPVTRAWLTVADMQTGPDTLWFGFDSTATYGLDPQLCEFEVPPIPPTGVFDVRFVNIAGHEGQDPPLGLGQGTKVDLRRYIGRTQVDTHRMRSQSSSPPGYPMHFRWSIPGLLAICDSARLIDEFGGIFINIRMDVIDSLWIQAGILLLIQYGQKLDLMSLHDKSSELPARVMLDQNYPNPFNPVTTIKYELPRESKATLEVFNALGQEIAILVNEVKQAGRYEVHWSAENFPSGVYFYKLSATDYIDVKKSVLVK